MNRLLIICRTPFQVITAIILAQNRLSNQDVDLIVTSDFRQAKDIAENCKHLSCFNEVLYFDYGLFNHIIGALIPKVYISQIYNEIKHQYRCIYTNSLYGDLENAILYYNNEADVVLFDEGYSSYLDSGLKKNLSLKHETCINISKLFYPRKLSHEKIKYQLLYDPDLIVRKMPYQIEKLWEPNKTSIDKLMKDVSIVFNIDDKISEYDRKYIYFEECFANDFNNNGDIEIINTISNMVGIDNLMVKLHPRDKTNRFMDKGIKTNTFLGVPTEALLPGLKDGNKIFLSFSSGSTINYKFTCDYNIKTILLYRLMPDSYIKMSDMQQKWFDQFISKYHRDIYAPKTIDELSHLLETL